MATHDVAAIVVRSLIRAQSLPAWHATLDPVARAWIAMTILSDALHPLGEFTMPSIRVIEDAIDRGLRNQAIWRAFDGRNYDCLAARYGLTTRQIRRIVEEERIRKKSDIRGN